MRSRLLRLLVAVPLLLGVMSAAVATAAPPLVLAAEGTDTGAEVEEELEPGPAPMGPDATDNPAAPADYEANFLWGAAAGLLVITLLGAIGLGLLYYLLVWRPKQRSETS